MDKNKKTILIPGWMNEKGMYNSKNSAYEVWDVWGSRIDPKDKINAHYLIGHSLGCNWALFNWKEDKNIKLILVNPLLPKRKIGEWFSRWIEFHKKEKPPEGKKTVRGMKNFWFGIKMCWKLLRYNFDEIIKNIPKEDVVIIHGEKDVFYCDDKFKEYIKTKKIKMIEVTGVGHDWHEKFDEEIKKITGFSPIEK